MHMTILCNRPSQIHCLNSDGTGDLSLLRYKPDFVTSLFVIDELYCTLIFNDGLKSRNFIYWSIKRMLIWLIKLHTYKKKCPICPLHIFVISHIFILHESFVNIQNIICFSQVCIYKQCQVDIWTQDVSDYKNAF